MRYNVYLSGEIHTDWRDRIRQGAEALQLPVDFSSAVTDHAASDAAGDVLGAESDGFWRDHKSAKVNAIRIRTLIERCDLGAALGKPYVTLHDEDIVHALKEVDAAAMAWARTPEQVVEVLRHVTTA